MNDLTGTTSAIDAESIAELVTSIKNLTLALQGAFFIPSFYLLN